MVGVPGRSKGCVTCRRRKKGCDLKRPDCGQCVERGMQCGGYDDDRVFVRSRYGMGMASGNNKAEGGGNVSSLVLSRRDSNPTMDMLAVTASTHDVLLPSFAQSVFSMQTTEAALNLFPTQQAAGQIADPFAALLSTLSIQEAALRQTISAVGLITLGKGSNNQTVLRKGRVLYGQALQELGLALQSPQRRSSEALLATTRLMGIYEILYGGAGGENPSQARNWMSHAQGEVALIVARGPEGFGGNAAHFMFALARYNSVIVSVRSRKASVFNGEQWKTVPWRGRVKPPNDSIIDILLQIPEIMADLDDIDAMPLDDEDFVKLRLETAAKCWTAHCELEAWFEANSQHVYTTDVEAAIPIEFPNLGTASLSLRYWATATLLYQSLDRALRYTTHDDLPPYTNRPHGRYFARRIVRSASWLFGADNGVTGATAVSFPLGVALMFLRQSEIPDPEYLNLVFSVWNDPQWPSSIKDFLRSMGNAIQLPTRKLPVNSVTWSTSEMEPILDFNGDGLSGPFGGNKERLYEVV